MRILYHYEQSVFSRRTRLALAHKGLDAELRDGRLDEAHAREARRLFPVGTMPVLVDDAKVVGDSTAIAHYLDLAYPDRPRLFPLGAADEVLSVTTAVDHAMNTLVELGTRFFDLRSDAAWAAITREKMIRAQTAIDTVASRATRAHLAGDAWSAADIWALSAVRWVTLLPARAATSPNVAQMLTLGFVLPEPLVAWAKQHASRNDVRAVFG
jgi:glutathione S-transferase